MTQTRERRDADLRDAVVSELTWTPNIDGTSISVTVDRGAVALSGDVDQRRIATRR